MRLEPRLVVVAGEAAQKGERGGSEHGRAKLAHSRGTRHCLRLPHRIDGDTMRLHHYLLFLATTAFACQPADTSAGAKQAIDAANAQWPRLTSSGHSDSIAQFYAADAVIMPPNMATLRGKDAVRAFLATITTIDPRHTLTLRAVKDRARVPVA